MGSGKYSAISGAEARMKALDVVANNLANINTTGYKAERDLFESYLTDAVQVQQAKGVNYTRHTARFIDFTEGKTFATNRQLDVAISGSGFFKVETDTGKYYTRVGSFLRAEDGSLLTVNGARVLDDADKPIELSDPAARIDDSGNILTSDGAVAGRLGVYEISEPERLVRQGEGMFRLEGDETQGVSPLMTPSLLPGHLEGSNVNLVMESATMMQVLRSFESLQKVLKSYSTISEKANELGTF